MSTDQKFVSLHNKRIMGLADFKDRLLDYLVNGFRDENKNHWTDGVFSTVAAVTATGNNLINIGAAAAIRAADGLGKTIILGTADSRFQNIDIPPDPGAAKVYTVGIEQSDVDSGIVTNPRTGEYEYDTFAELPGRLGVPTSVTDDGDGTITMVVDSILDASEDHSGRKVRVWLKSRQDGGVGPLAATEAEAFETLTVTWSGTQNEIATAGALGQSTISTTAADYRIMLEGPTVKLKTNEDLRNTSGAVFLADVTASASGNPITTISTTDQVLLGNGDVTGSGYGVGGAEINFDDSLDEYVFKHGSGANDVAEIVVEGVKIRTGAGSTYVRHWTAAIATYSIRWPDNLTGLPAGNSLVMVDDAGTLAFDGSLLQPYKHNDFEQSLSNIWAAGWSYSGALNAWVSSNGTLDHLFAGVQLKIGDRIRAISARLDRNQTTEVTMQMMYVQDGAITTFGASASTSGTSVQTVTITGINHIIVNTNQRVYALRVIAGGVQDRFYGAVITYDRP